MLPLPATNVAGMFVLFISHQWLGVTHPDTWQFIGTFTPNIIFETTRV